MNQRFHISYPILILSLLLTTFSCRRDSEIAVWDVDIIVPLAEGTLQLQDLTNDESLTEDSRKLFHIIYEEEVFNVGLDSLIGIPDTTIEEEYFIPIGGVYIFGGQAFQNELIETRYDIQDAQLLEAIVRTSNIEVNLQNTLDARMLVRYTIHSATLNGIVFQIEEFVDPNSTLRRDYTLNGYALDLTGTDQDSYNTLTTEVTIMLDPADSAYLLQTGDVFRIENSFTNIVPSYARGYFGGQSFDFQDSSPIEGFEQIPSGNVNFTEFDVSLNITNHIGADLSMLVNQIGSVNLSNSGTATLEHEIIDKSFLVGRATYLDLDSTRATRKIISFDEGNSNLDQLIEIRPDELSYDLNIQINPLGNVSLGNDFVVYGQNLKADLRVDVPLIVGLDGLRLVDTLDFAFERDGDDDPLNQVNHGQLNVYMRNAYPLQVGLQLYMQDAQGVVFDSLFQDQQWIESGNVNVNGIVNDTVESVVEVPVDQSRLDQFERTASLRAVATLNTTVADSVSLYSDGYLDVKIVGDFNADSR